MSAIRILFVEDSQDDVFLARYALNHAGIHSESHTVGDEPSLRRELETWEPDIIISDSMVPGFDGFRAFEISRELAPNVPFMFRTGRRRDARSLRALEQGACGWVDKDDGNEFIALVMNAVSAGREMVSLESPPPPLDS